MTLKRILANTVSNFPDDWRGTGYASFFADVQVENHPYGATGVDVKDAPPTADSAFRVACDRCNYIFGQDITDAATQCDLLGNEPPYSLGPYNNLNHVLFSDGYSSMRSAKETVKRFVQNLDPHLDQVGLVSFSSGNPAATKRTELECLRLYGTETCLTTGNPISFTNVLKAAEDIEASAGTNTAEGIQYGLEVLGLNPPDGNSVDNACDASEHSACAREGVKKVLILLTDGNPNGNPGGSFCSNADYGYGNVDFDCAIAFAEWAAQQGVIVYAVGIGYGVDEAFILDLGRYGNGQGFITASSDSLDRVFEAILKEEGGTTVPDLMVESIRATTLSTAVEASTLISVTLNENNYQGAWIDPPWLSIPFSVNLYIDPPTLPTWGEVGQVQWTVNSWSRHPWETVLTTVLTLSTTSPHTYYARVDSTNSIVESDEQNNLTGPRNACWVTPLAIPTATLSSYFFDMPLSWAVWDPAQLNNPAYIAQTMLAPYLAEADFREPPALQTPVQLERGRQVSLSNSNSALIETVLQQMAHIWRPKHFIAPVVDGSEIVDFVRVYLEDIDFSGGSLELYNRGSVPLACTPIVTTSFNSRQAERRQK